MNDAAPSPGRLVLYTPDMQTTVGRRGDGAEEYVALIGQVCVSAGSNKPYCHLYVMPPFAPAYWEGYVQEGEGPRSWRWPLGGSAGDRSTD